MQRRSSSAVPPAAREVRLASRPRGWPTEADFEIVAAPLTEPAAGQILVRNLVMSVDPIMRPLMNDAVLVAPPFQVGEPLAGGAVGEVVMSRSGRFAPGAIVLHHFGWREYATLDDTAAIELPAGVAPPAAHLGVLGVPGLTAYVGLLDVAGFQPGDAVFVSAAAGAVGSVVGQLARLRGASRVVGSCGSAKKVRYLLDELGFDAAFNYRDGPVEAQLRAAAPAGIDVYFDNVGGEQLEAAIGSMRDFGRIAACGAVSQYNLTEPSPGPRNLFQIVFKRLTLRGFVVYLDHPHRRQQFLDEVCPLVREGRLSYRETIVDGLDHAPGAFLGMLRGANTGKMLVNLG